MGSEPKRRNPRSAKRTRRASINLGMPILISCKNCNKPTLPHIVCKNCGFYSGKSVTKEKVKVTKAESDSAKA